MSPEVIVIVRKLSKMSQYKFYVYEEIDYQLLHRSVPQIIEDLTGFVEEVTNQL